VKQGRYRVANLAPQTLINAYPDSECVIKAKEVLDDPRIAPCGESFTSSPQCIDSGQRRPKPCCFSMSDITLFQQQHRIQCAMTCQNRTFIELSDILSFRFECPECRCAVAIPIVEFNHVPRECPNGCGRDWEEMNSHGVGEAFDELGRSMRLVQGKISKVGLSFSLELKDPLRSYQDPFLGKTQGGDTNEENESPQAKDLKIMRKKKL